jgi:sigma-B regulation protein RsbU (phosphoserine phosphatase)
MLMKDRCIGVMDLESPDYDAFGKDDVEVLSALASQVAVAIENARLYEALRANEDRIERELQFARRVQAALLPAGLPKRMRGVDVAAHFTPARELGGDLHDFLSPESNSLVVAVGDVSGKGVPAALYSVFAAELVRSRTFRRRYMPERFSPAGVLMSINTILYERQLEGYYCTLCYAYFDLKRRTLTMANSGLPYTLKSTEDSCLPIELPGFPLGSFPGVSYDQIVLELGAGDIFVFCTDGIYETFNAADEEFGAERVAEIVQSRRREPAAAIVQAIVDAADGFRGDAPQADDVTIVVVKIG